MSLEQIRAALEVSADIPAPAAHVLLVLASYSNSDGLKAYPSVATIARHTHMDSRTVQRALAALRIAGLVSLVDRSIGRLPNGYQLHLNPVSPTPVLKSPRHTTTVGNSSNPVTDASQPRHVDTQSLRDPSETQEKSAGTRASPTGALPAQAPERTPEQREHDRTALLEIAAKIRAEPGGNGTRRPDPTRLHKPVTMTDAERTLEIERRRRQAATLADEAALKPK